MDFPFTCNFCTFSTKGLIQSRYSQHVTNDVQNTASGSASINMSPSRCTLSFLLPSNFLLPSQSRSPHNSINAASFLGSSTMPCGTLGPYIGKLCGVDVGATGNAIGFTLGGGGVWYTGDWYPCGWAPDGV